jgi:hypothetical protein
LGSEGNRFKRFPLASLAKFTAQSDGANENENSTPELVFALSFAFLSPSSLNYCANITLFTRGKETKLWQNKLGYWLPAPVVSSVII